MRNKRNFATFFILAVVIFTTVVPYNEALANRGGVLYRLRNHGTQKLYTQGFYLQSEPAASYTTSGQWAWFRYYLYPGTYRFHALKDRDVTGNIQLGIARNGNWVRVTNQRRNWATVANFRVNRSGWYQVGVWNGGTNPNGGWVGTQFGQR